MSKITGTTVEERAAFVEWLRSYAGGADNWRDNVTMGEHA